MFVTYTLNIILIIMVIDNSLIYGTGWGKIANLHDYIYIFVKSKN